MRAHISQPIADKAWLIPCTLLTVGLALACLPLSGGHRLTGTPDLALPLYGWLLFGLAFLFAWTSGRLIWFAVHREPHPAAAFGRDFRILASRLPIMAIGLLLASLDLYFFMWLKPQLTAAHPFWADTAIANIGHFIFGQDPWRYLTFMLVEPVAVLYTPVWFTAVIATMYWLLLQPPTERRARLLITYFLLWSVFGPLGQTFFSAAGPIFYHRITGSSRYDELTAQLPYITRLSSDYLWNAYRHGSLVSGAGISAMPSLHVATVAWGVMVFHREKAWLRAVSWLFAILIPLASVALGWHYAMDGLAAAPGALACYGVAALWTRAWIRKFGSAAHGPVANEPR